MNTGLTIAQLTALCNTTGRLPSLANFTSGGSEMSQTCCCRASLHVVKAHNR